jgi:tRNA A22 N-methylase
MTALLGQLPLRLQVAHELVSPSRCVADIGCDHALLSIALASTGVAERVIACDASEHSLRGARANIAAHAPEGSRIETRLGDGLAPLGRGEVDELAMCGLGALKMERLLDHGAPAALGVRALVLQPVAARLPQMHALREALWRQGYVIECERYSRDQSRHYLTLRATLGRAERRPADDQLLLGDGLSLQAHEPNGFGRFLREQQAQLDAEVRGMRVGLSGSAHAAEAIARHERWLQVVNEQLRWCAEHKVEHK